MNSTEYSADRRDIAFVQKELLKIQTLLEFEPFRDFSEEDLDMVISEGVQFAETIFAPANRVGDQHGSRLENGGVKMPPEFKKIWQAYCDGGWMGITSRPEFGGQGLPLSAALGVMENFYGANPALYTVAMLTAGAAGLIAAFGDEAQQATFCEKMVNGTWGGTMCLSEQSAGSAVGDITTRAVKAKAGGHYLIKGTKQWISGGDHDLTENIVHLVLARAEGAPQGPKGISLFIVPKFRLDEGGHPATPNDVATVSVEHKLGIKGSPTCVLEFGANGDCHGYLLEGENLGMGQMFKLMNEARLTVAYQGLGSASGAFRNAWAYAQERVQGIPIEKGKDQGAERTAIVHHPDVRNMLMTMKALVEGVRGVIYATAFCQDMAHHGPAEDRPRYQALADFLTPIAKNAGADQGFEAVRLGVQVLGGVGFTEDFPLAQALRDTKIASIYEGTSGIQALDLVTRKLTIRNGELFKIFLEELDTISAEQAKTEPVRQAIAAWRDGVEKLKGTVASLRNLTEELGPREGVFNATDVTVFFCDIACSYYLLKGALVAETKLEALTGKAGDGREAATENEEVRFYFNKVKTAEHYVHQILPRYLGTVARVQARNFAALDAVF